MASHVSPVVWFAVLMARRPRGLGNTCSIYHKSNIPRDQSSVNRGVSQCQGYRIWPEGSGVCAGNRVPLSGAGGREVDEKFDREKRDRIFPTSSHRFPFSPILPANSRFFLSAPLLWDKDFQIRSHCVPFLLFPAFGQALPLRLLADTSWGAVRPAQASSTIYRTHDPILSKSRRLGKRPVSSGYPNATALVTVLHRVEEFSMEKHEEWGAQTARPRFP